MIASGLIEGEERLTGAGRRAPRYYRLTPFGQRCHREAQRLVLAGTGRAGQAGDRQGGDLGEQAMKEHRMLRLSGKALRIVLLAYPAAHRREYGRLMLDAFRDSARDEYEMRGMAGLVGLWASTLGDVLISALEEHADAVLHSPRPLLRMSGAAAMLGGAAWTMLHTPLGWQWFAMPVIALSLLLMSVILLYVQQRHFTGWGGRCGFALTAAGLLVIQGGYTAAGLGLWRQSGITPLAGALLLFAGLLLIGDAVLRARTITRGRGLFFALSLLNGLGGLPVLALLR
jgi:hypothetical protein